MAKLPGDYIAGFVDGEGHFGFRHYKEVKKFRGGKKRHWEGWRWIIVFGINLHSDDHEILKDVRDTLGCGSLYEYRNRPMIFYVVSNFNDIVTKVIPFFEKYPLHAKKKKDFELWKRAADILQRAKKRPGGRSSKLSLSPVGEAELISIDKDLKVLHYKKEVHRKFHRGNK